jgi:hypothetical protein
MKMLANDLRRLRIYRVTSMDGEIKIETAGDAWQDPSGVVLISGLWVDGLITSQEDLKLSAELASVSTLEYFRSRLTRCPGIRVEVIE